jgi:tRNA A37 N6-isopentenylltransferase MiaA
MPNFDPEINEQNTLNEESTSSTKFEKDLLPIRDERQQMICPNCHPTYNERHQKIIELINWTLEKYKAAATNIEKKNQQNDEETIIIDNIIEELDKKRDIAINKKKKALLMDEVSIYRLEETSLDYILFIIREWAGKYY